MYNQAETIPLFLKALAPVLDRKHYDFELLFVNDGSTDATLQVLCEARQHDSRIRILELSRNFCKKIGMSAGLNGVSGEAVIPLDVDLQAPPELVGAFLRKWEEDKRLPHA